MSDIEILEDLIASYQKRSDACPHLQAICVWMNSYSNPKIEEAIEDGDSVPLWALTIHHLNVRLKLLVKFILDQHPQPTKPSGFTFDDWDILEKIFQREELSQISGAIRKVTPDER